MFKKLDLVEFKDLRIVGMQVVFEVRKSGPACTFIFDNAFNRNTKVDNEDLRYEKPKKVHKTEYGNI